MDRSNMSIDEQVEFLMQGTEYGDEELKKSMAAELKERLVEAKKEGRPLRVYCGYDPVKPDLDFDNLVDTVFHAILIFGFLHPARGVRDIGMLGTDSGAEKLNTRTGSILFDFRCFCAAFCGFLGYCRSEVIDGRGPHRPSSFASRATARRTTACRERDR